jgi:hypothetical protein
MKMEEEGAQYKEINGLIGFSVQACGWVGQMHVKVLSLFWGTC